MDKDDEVGRTDLEKLLAKNVLKALEQFPIPTELMGEPIQRLLYDENDRPCYVEFSTCLLGREGRLEKPEPEPEHLPSEHDTPKDYEPMETFDPQKRAEELAMLVTNELAKLRLLMGESPRPLYDEDGYMHYLEFRTCLLGREGRLEKPRKSR